MRTYYFRLTARRQATNSILDFAVKIKSTSRDKAEDTLQKELPTWGIVLIELDRREYVLAAKYQQ